MFRIQHQLKYKIGELLSSFRLKDTDVKGFLNQKQFKQLLKDYEIVEDMLQIKQVNPLEYFLCILSDNQQNGSPSCYIHQYIKSMTSKKKQYEEKRMYEEASIIHDKISATQGYEYGRRLNILKDVQSQKQKQFWQLVLNQIKQLQLQWQEHMHRFQQNSKLLIESAQTKCKHSQAAQKKQYIKSKSKSKLLKSHSKSLSPPSKPTRRQRSMLSKNNYKAAIQLRNSFNTKVHNIQISNQNQQLSRHKNKLDKLKKNNNMLLQNIKYKVSKQKVQQLNIMKKQYMGFNSRLKCLVRQFYNKQKQQEKQLMEALNQQFNINININSINANNNININHNINNNGNVCNLNNNLNINQRISSLGFSKSETNILFQRLKSRQKI